MSLLFPAGLAALAALLLPLLLHLQRQAEARPTDFAALRWLAEKLRPRQRLRLQEWLLLLLRLLLVACIALLFAQPVWQARGEGRPWVLVSPQLPAAQLQALQSTPKSALSSYPPDADWRWLAPGFPSFDQAAPAEPANTASLLREADAVLPPKAALIVLVPEVLGGLDGERPRLARAVQWRVVPGAVPAPAALTPRPPRPLSLHVAEGREAQARYLRAAALANGRVVDAGAPGKALPAKTDTLIWLVPGEVPTALRDWTRAGGTLMLDAQSRIAGVTAGAVRWQDELGAPLLREARLGGGRVLQWQRALQPAQMPQLLEADFASRLDEVLKAPTRLPARADAEALRPLQGARNYPRPPMPLDAGLAWLALGLLLVERWLATRAARGAAA